MSHNQLPSIGRIVHWSDERGKYHAAIITGIVSGDSRDSVFLTVFPDPTNERRDHDFRCGPIPHEDHAKVGEPRWRWPPYIPPTKTPAEAEIDNPRLTPQGG